MIEIIYQDELEVIFSLMVDKDLLILKDKVEDMIKNDVYRIPKFPLSCAGLRHVQAVIMFTYWMRRGKGIRIEGGEIVVCELDDSPFMERYKDKVEDEEIDRREAEAVEHVGEPIKVEEKGEWV